MKLFLVLIATLIPVAALAQQSAESDSVTSTLDEVVVTAGNRNEISGKVILRPTKLERRHSTNGFVLLENMNLPDFNVDAATKSITTLTGGSVVILINGVESQPDDLSTLAAQQIVRIDYRRNPGGKYVGAGAVMNFITAQYDYGGNVYACAEDGFLRHYGNYTAMANYRRKALTLTVTANGKWGRASELRCAENTFWLSDGVLNQSVTPIENRKCENSQYLNLKFAHSTGNHSFDLSVALTRRAVPLNLMQDQISYSGLWNFASASERKSTESGLSPVIKTHYNLYFSGGQTLMLIGTLRYGHTNFRSSYRETDAVEIVNNSAENSILTSATVGYFKTFSNGLSAGATLDEYLTLYRDRYTGDFCSDMTLGNNLASLLLHVDQTFPWGLTYYTSFGIYDHYSALGTTFDNKLSPKLFYGFSFTINQNHSVSVTGSYLHSLFDPSNKNDAIIRTSFFEATVGNPDLAEIRSFQNLLSYNARVGLFGLSVTYDFLKYFGNTSNRYYVIDNMMFRQLVNDGSFHYNKFLFGVTANLLNNRLRLKGNVALSMNRFDSVNRPLRSNDWRGDLSAAFAFGDWQLNGTYAFPYSVLGCEGVKVSHSSQYSLSLSWQKGNLAAECKLENFMHSRRYSRMDADYGVYQTVSRSWTDMNGRNLSVTLTYMLPYGKKTDKEAVQTESTINSAILRPF